MNYKGLNYTKKGLGKPILLLHGWGASIEVWHKVMQEFSQDYCVYAVDLYGFGKSSEPIDNATIYDYTKIVDEFITSVIGEPVILVGHSFGGRVGLILGNSLNVRALILVDSAGLKPRFSLKKYIKIRQYKRLKQKVSLGKADKEQLQKFGSQDYKALSSRMKQVFVNVVNEDLEKYSKIINKPTLLLWGREDKETPVYMAKKLKRNIKKAKLVLLNGGHYCFLDDFDNFIRECFKFFDELGEKYV